MLRTGLPLYARIHTWLPRCVCYGSLRLRSVCRFCLRLLYPAVAVAACRVLATAHTHRTTVATLRCRLLRFTVTAYTGCLRCATLLGCSHTFCGSRLYPFTITIYGCYRSATTFSLRARLHYCPVTLQLRLPPAGWILWFTAHRSVLFLPRIVLTVWVGLVTRRSARFTAPSLHTPHADVYTPRVTLRCVPVTHTAPLHAHAHGSALLPRFAVGCTFVMPAVLPGLPYVYLTADLVLRFATVATLPVTALPLHTFTHPFGCTAVTFTGICWLLVLTQFGYDTPHTTFTTLCSSGCVGSLYRIWVATVVIRLHVRMRLRSATFCDFTGCILPIRLPRTVDCYAIFYATTTVLRFPRLLFTFAVYLHLRYMQLPFARVPCPRCGYLQFGFVYRSYWFWFCRSTLHGYAYGCRILPVAVGCRLLVPTFVPAVAVLTRVSTFTVCRAYAPLRTRLPPPFTVACRVGYIAYHGCYICYARVCYHLIRRTRSSRLRGYRLVLPRLPPVAVAVTFRLRTRIRGYTVPLYTLVPRLDFTQLPRLTVRGWFAGLHVWLRLRACAHAHGSHGYVLPRLVAVTWFWLPHTGYLRGLLPP